MNARTVGYVVLIGLMVWATAGAQEKAPTKAKLAASPEEAVMMQNEAAKAGDVETYFGLWPSRVPRSGDSTLGPRRPRSLLGKP